MKKIECIIRPLDLMELENKLTKVVSGMTVTHVKGCGAQKGETQMYRGTEMTICLLPKIKIEIVVPEEKVDEVVNAVMDVCRSGSVGDGKIFIMPVEEAIRIRTGDRGIKAL